MENYSRTNEALAALSPGEFARLLPDLEQVTLPVNQALFRYGDSVDYTYFPLTAVVSLVCLLEGGKSVEVGQIGREGVVGLPTMLGPNNALYAAEVLVPGAALRVRAEALRKHYVMNDPFCRQLIQHSWSLFSQFSRLAACNLCHHIPERVSRWLLMLQDRAVQDEFHLTHEQIAERLGIRRSGVTVQLGLLENEGAIRASRGRIKIIDRDKLEKVSCECYKYLIEESRLACLPPQPIRTNLASFNPYVPRQVELTEALSAVSSVR